MRISDWSSDVCSSDLKTNTYGVTRYEELPEKARTYLQRIAEITETEIAIVSTGQDSDHTMVLHHPLDCSSGAPQRWRAGAMPALSFLVQLTDFCRTASERKIEQHAIERKGEV